MVENIKNGDLIITKTLIKEEILKEITKSKKLIDCKFMTIEEFKRNSFISYDEKALYYLMKKYKLKYSIAKEYLDNIHFNHKDIKPYYEDLKNQNLIITKQMTKFKRILIIGYENIEPYILEKINKYENKTIKLKEDTYIPKVYSFNTQTDEIVYTATKIIEDLKNTDINKIKLIIPSDEYTIELSRIFALFNIPVNIPSKENIYSKKTSQIFLTNLKEKLNISKALENTPQNDTYNLIVDILNKYTFIKNVDNTFIEIIENELKTKKPKIKKYKNVVEVIDINQIYEKQNHYYILGLNQNVIPKIYKDNGIISDKHKKELGLFETNNKNKNEKLKIQTILTHFPNLHISFKKQDNFSEFYPSSIISDLNLEIINNPKPELIYSNKYNKLLLASLLDSYINYNEEDERIKKLYPNYESLEYKTYDNAYTKIDEKKLKEYLKESITLSYSSMNNYFLCPFKFYIENILKLNNYEETFPVLIGNLFHHCLQNLYEKDFELDKCFTNYLKDTPLTPKENHFIKKLYDILKQDIEVIKMQDNASNFKEKITEKKITVEKNSKLNVKFVGVVDKISKLDNYIIITDYKTGSVQTNLDNITDGLNLQLPAYIYLIKNGIKKDYKIAGFYLQKLINSKPVDSEEEPQNNLKLNGYTINDENIIKEIDDTYENSQVIKGMKKTKTGFYAYTKLITEKEIEKIENIVSENIDKVIKAIETADFKINPKRLENELISCKFCKYKDLCFYKEEDITNLKTKPLKEIIGDENAKLD